MLDWWRKRIRGRKERIGVWKKGWRAGAIAAGSEGFGQINHLVFDRFCILYFSFSTSQWAQNTLKTVYQWPRRWSPSPWAATPSDLRRMTCERPPPPQCNLPQSVCAKRSFTRPHFSPARFRTPNIHRSIMESSPCTPTSFKSASALQEAKYGPLKLPVRSELTSSLVPLPCCGSLEVSSCAADGGVHQTGADGVCHWTTSSEEDQTGGKRAAEAAEVFVQSEGNINTSFPLFLSLVAGWCFSLLPFRQSGLLWSVLVARWSPLASGARVCSGKDKNFTRSSSHPAAVRKKCL